MKSTDALPCLALFGLFNFIGFSGCSSDAPTAATNGADAAQAQVADAEVPQEAPAPPGSTPLWAGQRPDEPFDVRQYLTIRAVPADNAATLYHPALDALTGEMGNESGRALSASIGRLADLDQLVAGSISPDQVHHALAQAQGAVQQIDAAQAKPQCVFVTPFSIEALLPHAQAARTVARHSTLQLFQARHSGDFAAALSATRRGMRMSRDVQPRGFVVCQLVSIAMDTVVLNAVERLTLQDPQLTVAKCDQLLEILAEHQRLGLDRYGEALRVEYLVTRNTIEDLASGRLSLSTVVGLLGVSNLPADGSPLPINADLEVATANRLFALALKEAEMDFAQVAESSEFGREVARLQESAKVAIATAAQTGKLDVPFVCLLLAPPLTAAREADLRGRANLAGVQSLVALRRFELAHGHLPAKLEDAAAETILKTAPRDPFDGQPMRFARVTGRPLVYSVGKDGRDDGGRSDWDFGNQPGDYLFVFHPRPGTALSPPLASTSPEAPTEPALAPVPAAAPTNASESSLSRTWTSTVGTTIEAEFVGLEGNLVTLKKRDGNLLRVPRDKLSRQDQQWMDERSSKTGK